ncbi:MAG: STAS domain-containing protein [Bdellovibrionales bacterium]|nr:STAS domain-containing protein [Bdellovibrionales bacterium]
MDLKLEIAQPWVVVHLSGRIDSFNYDDITAKIQTLIRMGKINFAIDLTQVTYLGLPTLRFLYSTAGKLEQKKGSMVLVVTHERIKKSIALVNQPVRFQLAADRSYLTSEPTRMSP